MADASAPHRRRFSWKTALDVVTSLVMIGAAVFLVMSNLSSRARSRPELRIPEQPVSIEGAATKGSPTAPVVMIAFADFQCPFCGRFAREVLPELQKDYIETGRVQLVYRHLPLPNHPLAVPAARAAECAGQQGQFWPMHDGLFAEGAQLDEAGLRSLVGALAVDPGDLAGCLADPQVAELVRRDAETARALGLPGTPSFLLGSRLPDSRVDVFRVFSGARSAAQFRQEMDRALASVQTPWWRKLLS